MRLLRLELQRYGHLTDVSLAFDPACRLHVVHGLNEAGKSTTLQAIADVLFGFGHRSDYDFLHTGPRLRVGVTLEASDGQIGRFFRRKGRSNTLMDENDVPVPEAALRHYLGSATRDVFERVFGLDGVRLRAGGEDLLRSGGEAGESLLAGGGLLHLNATMRRLDDEAKALFGTRQGKRRVHEAVERWRAAQSRVSTHSVAPRAWTEETERLEQIRAELERLQTESRALSIEATRLHRLRRVAPLLAALDLERATVAALADAPLLPPDTHERHQEALTELRDAMRDVEREAASQRDLRAKLAGVTPDPDVLAVQDAIDALVLQVPVIAQAAKDLPALRFKVVQYQERVRSALSDLGRDVPPETARDTVPPESARRGLQRLITGRGALVEAERTALAALARAQEDSRAATDAVQSSPMPQDPAALRGAIHTVRGEGRLEDLCARATRTLAAAAAATSHALAALPLWTGDAAALAACPVPLPAEADRAATVLTETKTQLAKARDAHAVLAGDLGQTERQIAILAEGETMPTPDAVAAARAARDAVWRLIRQSHPENPDAAAAQFDPFEDLRDTADHLSDRRADEAQRVADYLARTAQRAELQRRLAEAEADLVSAETAVTAAEATWQALWGPSGMVPGVPAAMEEWRRARAEVLRLAGAEAAAEETLRDVLSRREHAMALLRSFLPDSPASDLLAPLLTQAEAACERMERQVKTYQGLVEAAARARTALPELERAAALAVDGLAAWQTEWTRVAEGLGLSGETDVELAETALAAWTRIAETAPAWKVDAQRVSAMEHTIAAFDTEVAAVRARLSDPPSDEASMVTVARLGRRLSDARAAAVERAGLLKTLAALEEAERSARARMLQATGALEVLRDLAHAPDDDALKTAIQRSDRRADAEKEASKLLAKLIESGDGLAEANLRDELAGLDPDAAKARIEEIEGALSDMAQRREVLSSQRTESEVRLADMQRGHDAATAAQEAQDALADAKEAAERYASLHVARTLLARGIDRFRQDQQDPLLRRTGIHFAQLTGNRYTRLVTDIDTPGRMVIEALRNDGVPCPISSLSEGTRDQLYLALRVSSLEQYVAGAEPLPFIADDLLVQFDDERARAAMALLRELGTSTQVVLFTHHRHVAEIAADMDGVGVIRLEMEKRKEALLF